MSDIQLRAEEAAEASYWNQRNTEERTIISMAQDDYRRAVVGMDRADIVFDLARALSISTDLALEYVRKDVNLSTDTKVPRGGFIEAQREAFWNANTRAARITVLKYAASILKEPYHRTKKILMDDPRWKNSPIANREPI